MTVLLYVLPVVTLLIGIGVGYFGQDQIDNLIWEDADD